MNKYNIILEDNYETIVGEYHSNKKKSSSYQTEADLEKEFINILKSQGYEFLNINNEKDLILNLKIQLEKLNKIKFSDKEWDYFFINYIANKKEGIQDKIEKIQSEQYILELKRDDGSIKNIYLIHKKNNQDENITNNTLQVINQYEVSEGNFKNRYDVTILINGLPLVHVELKKRGVDIKEAFNQINRYQRDSFWMESGLFQYVQIFVISNGTDTKYYSNNVRSQNASVSNKKKSFKNGFEFTSYWSDSKNKIIPDLIDFAYTFFYKNTLLNILTKYSVFNVEKQLLLMRPYQIAATEKIINKIIMSYNHKLFGSQEANGYIWHTTGSGKTLTSFKTALLASQLDFINKVLFVVDRKDLDHQTMAEYAKYQEGAADTSRSTKELQRKLEDHGSKIIITTIQKLAKFIKSNNRHEIYKQNLIFIFDECHRSQFGDMHQKIKNNFKNSCLFGFTGTPIFNIDNKINFKTTQDLFKTQLHTYTIVDAINDHNVLKFNIDYLKSLKIGDEIKDYKVKAINESKALNAPARIDAITKYIIKNFDLKTKRNERYQSRDNKILAGFNSIFAVSSIESAKAYYLEFQKQLKQLNSDLVVTTIFSYNPNEAETDFDAFDEELDADKLDLQSKEFLEKVIKDYNQKFNTNASIKGDSFENFYKDVSKKMKEKKIDILIVVNMFLTGFDAPTLNTLWVDKNLKTHGLIQAFSRTNRIFNRVKSFGQIVCFRELKKDTDEALKIFGDKDIKNLITIPSFQELYYGYDENEKHHSGYVELAKELETQFPVDEMIYGETNQKKFIKLYNRILFLKNTLNSFDKFSDAEKILSERDFQNYEGKYLDIRDQLTKETEKENIIEDLTFEIELIQQDEINVDYILNLIQKEYYGKVQKKSLADIEKMIDASLALRSKKLLILDFINKYNPKNDPSYAWKEYIEKAQADEVETIIKENQLNPEATKKYLENCYKNGELKTIGTDLSKILPPISRFDEKNNYSNMKNKIIEIFRNFWKKYID